MGQVNSYAFIHLLCLQRILQIFYTLSTRVYNKLQRTIPGIDTIMEKVHVDSASRGARRKQKREAQLKAEQEEALYGRGRTDS